MVKHPFYYGNPVSPVNFLDRRQPLRRVVGRLMSDGQSTAVIGEPRIGKTSLLYYLAASETRKDLYGDRADHLSFSYLDVQMLGTQFSPVQFWIQALKPIKEQFVDLAPGSLLAQQYRLCDDNGFGNFTLEMLFRLLNEKNWRLVLLLDEFDLLLHHPILNSAEFFGGLRSLTSRSGGALALVVSSRLPLLTLSMQTKKLNPTGSPYFNIFSETILGSFPEKDVTGLLNRASNRFTIWDKRAIRVVAGGHPFLLQTAAAAMWDAWEDGITETSARRRYMGQHLYREQKLHFADTWQVWSPDMRKAFTTVALAHTAHLLPQREFLTNAFIEGQRDFGPELDDLEVAGLVTPDERMGGGWRVVPQAMLWWLADELVRAIRMDTPLEDWLRAQELDNLLSHKEREQFGQVVRGAVQVLQQGATTLIEAFAKGLGEGTAKGLTQ